MNARFNHRAAIARCIDDADEAQWFAAHPDRQYYLRPSCPAEIKRRRLILPDHTPRKLEPGCRWFMLAIRLKRGGFNHLLTPYCADITGEEDDETLQDVFRLILGAALRRQGWQP